MSLHGTFGDAAVDRDHLVAVSSRHLLRDAGLAVCQLPQQVQLRRPNRCLLYTSDAADEGVEV